MCGITGAVWHDPTLAVEQETLQRMVNVLRHRGPDDSGQYVSAFEHQPAEPTSPGVALGHRRLAIIDPEGGHQPIGNEDGSVWVIFNGEIYNFVELHRRLEAAGHRFRTRCDTEVLVHLYEEDGPAMLGQLNGMFALAVWDARHRELLLAHDRLGQKPLVFRHRPGQLLFASELKSILQVPGVRREVDPRALDEYLTYQYVPHPRTIFRGIEKLPPGHYALYCEDRLQVHPYWQADFRTEESLPVADYAEELRRRLSDSVKLRLQSDVPLGAFLSGGVDSTIIVGLMAELSDRPVRTFSIGFPVAEYDESHYGRMAAERFGTVHEEFVVEPNAIEVLPHLLQHFDEPLGDSSAVPTWYVSQLTRGHVSVALTGDGGDELFAGYLRYRAAALADRFDRLPGLVRRVLAGRWWQWLPAGARQKSALRLWKRFVEALGQTPSDRYLDWVAIFNTHAREELYSDPFARSLPNYEVGDFLAAPMAAAARRGPVAATSMTDLVTYLPCDLMTKVDMASMAHGLECRQPFLDHRVVELALRMPTALKFQGGRGKRILLDTFADLLPQAIRRREKMGFALPLDHWFRHELHDFTREVLLDRETLARGYFRPDAVHRLIDDHQSGRSNHAAQLWSLLILELWHRQWATPNGS